MIQNTKVDNASCRAPNPPTAHGMSQSQQKRDIELLSETAGQQKQQLHIFQQKARDKIKSSRSPLYVQMHKFLIQHVLFHFQCKTHIFVSSPYWYIWSVTTAEVFSPALFSAAVSCINAICRVNRSSFWVCIYIPDTTALSMWALMIPIIWWLSKFTSFNLQRQLGSPSCWLILIWKRAGSEAK